MVARLINREVVMPQYPQSELDEMAHKLDREVKHAMLHNCYTALAQAFHEINIAISRPDAWVSGQNGYHNGSDFKFCQSLTCKQFVEVLKKTK